MEVTIKTISIDRETKEILKEINEYKKISNDPWDKFFKLMGEELMKRKESKNKN